MELTSTIHQRNQRQGKNQISHHRLLQASVTNIIKHHPTRFASTGGCWVVYKPEPEPDLDIIICMCFDGKTMWFIIKLQIPFQSLVVAGRSLRGRHDLFIQRCDDLASYLLQLQDSEKVSNNFIIKMTESDISLHAANVINHKRVSTSLMRDRKQKRSFP